MDSALTPREIQSRIRAGESIEDVARAAGAPTEKIETFAEPVLAERAYIASQARGAQTRRISGISSHLPLGESIELKLSKENVQPDAISWDAWRDPHRDNRHWTIRVSYAYDDADHEAFFDFDPRGRYASPENSDARWLLDDVPPSPTPAMINRSGNPDAEPTIKLDGDMALVHAVQPEEKPTVGDGSILQELYAAAASNEAAITSEADSDGLRQIDGVFDIVPNPTSDMDVLYDMLSGFDEDSVHVYEGLSQPVTQSMESFLTGSSPDSSETAFSETPEAGGQHSEQKVELEPTLIDPINASGDIPSAAKTLSDADAPDSQGALVETPGKKPKPKQKRKKAASKSHRASVPTWDEIMFGGNTPSDDKK